MNGVDTNRSKSTDARAVIDIGSNTVRLVVYGGPRRAPTILLNEKVTARLGRQLAKTGSMPEEACSLALGGLARFALLVTEMQVEDVQTVATAAVRDADNGAEFLERVAALGLAPRLLSGREEAETSAFGVLGAFPGASGIVADLGGGSLELVEIAQDAPSHGLSLPLGTLRLPGMRAQGAAKFDKSVRRMIAQADYAAEKGENLFLVGGTLRSFARYAMVAAGSPLEDPHGYVLDPAQAAEVCAALSTGKPGELERIPGISSSRAAMLPDAAALLGVLIDELQPSRLTVSAWGLREGLLYQAMTPITRAQDPLLAGAADFTSPSGATLVTATVVAGWTADIAAAAGDGPHRLRLAAIMLALALARLEPNIRRRHALDWALHKRWIGVGAPDRAVLGAALLGACGSSKLPGELQDLASPEQLKEGLIWGLATRLCRKLAAGTVRSFGETRLRVEDDAVVLHLSERLMPLYQDSIEKDLKQVAEKLGRGWRVDRL
ncbi:Ppx/GppA family phosphatase [Altericroceibacterium xinjiangense]|uniref:Ppx/GppA family phosphatase n=1 Tax=Altericroceibacterium xinjiangense TaxID=762261 RepID=UPI000F7F58BA|nr:Ppx/GppA family phosphatase [Altericroceibacterium xinjiangense]